MVSGTASDLGGGIEQAVAEERERVESFPDMPDAADSAPDEADEIPGVDDAPGELTERVMRERETVLDPYVITAHKSNFILPFSYTNQLNDAVYDVAEVDGFKHVEVKFQISFKTQLNRSDLFLKDDSLSLGFTLEAWWQLYSSDLSSPFRETNYQPEIIYLKPLLWGPFGGSTALLLGFEHQSNGQFQGRSRSWNRLYAGLIYEREDLLVQLRPWYRIPEDEKDDPSEADGDDNPDILDFMGHGDLTVSLRRDDHDYQMLLRGNPTTGKGAVRLRWTFPFFSRFSGLFEYFNGYGDSLIDYDVHQQRVGLGVVLTPLF